MDTKDHIDNFLPENTTNFKYQNVKVKFSGEVGIYWELKILALREFCLDNSLQGYFRLRGTANSLGEYNFTSKNTLIWVAKRYQILTCPIFYKTYTI